MSEKRSSLLAPFSSIAEPDLQFGGAATNRDTNPLRGLRAFGPFTTSLAAFTPSIRVAIVGPTSGFDARRALLRSLRQAHEAKDRPEYVPAYPGFQELFGLDLQPAPAECQVTVGETLDELPPAGTPAEQVRAAITGAVRQLGTVRDRFDVAVVHLPDRWGRGLRAAGFDAHDELKAQSAEAGIPTQVVNDRTFGFDLLASRSWRLAIALYVKAGGVPWKLAPITGAEEDTAYIGLAYAFRGDQKDARFVTCCSQVFDADGGGMQFVAYDAEDPIEDTREARRNPYLSRDDMRAVLARSLSLYQARNGGLLPRRVVVHKTTAFRESELLGAADALAAVPEMDCIEITTNVAWRGVWLRKARQAGGKLSEPDGYPVRRGTTLQLSGSSVLVWVAGNAPAASDRGNYYQGKKSIPKPLLLTRHAGQGPLEPIAAEVLALSKMDWNNDALYDPVPVTIRYSQRLARTIANVPTLRREVYAYRLFM